MLDRFKNVIAAFSGAIKTLRENVNIARWQQEHNKTTTLTSQRGCSLITLIIDVQLGDRPTEVECICVPAKAGCWVVLAGPFNWVVFIEEEEAGWCVGLSCGAEKEKIPKVPGIAVPPQVDGFKCIGDRGIIFPAREQSIELGERPVFEFFCAEDRPHSLTLEGELE